MTTSLTRGTAGAAPSDFLKERGGFLLLLLAALAPIPLFWFGATNLAYEWSKPEYSHGPLIPVLSAFMFLREMSQVPPVQHEIRDRRTGLWIIGAAFVIAAFGNMVRIPDLVFYSMIIWVAGMVLVCFGFRRGIFFWPAVLHLVFMLPIPNFIYWPITVFLQGVSSEVGVYFVRLAGIPVYLDGHIIDLGEFKLLVAEACSGLRYLFPIMSFSYIFCVLYKGPWWIKATLLLSAVPIAVFMNSFRIGVIGVLVNSYGIEHAEGFLHYFEGWVIFASCIGLLFGMVLVMQLFTGDRRSISDALDLEFTEVVPQLKRSLAVPATRALGVAAALGLAVSAAVYAAPSSQSVEVDRRDFAVFPRQLDGWAGQFDILDPGVERVLGADDYLSAYYVNRDYEAPVDLFVAWYEKQTEGSGIHSPEVCLPAGGWEMFNIEEHQVTPAADTGVAPFEVNRAIIQKGSEQRQLVWYWFDQAGDVYTNDFAAKAGSMYNTVTRGRTDGALVRLMTPIVGTDVAGAEARLQSMLNSAMTRLPEFLPN
ncbi:MAG: VPLPA-CTERM-specific exosortase XrtD [Pseudomonadota bacterium]